MNNEELVVEYCNILCRKQQSSNQEIHDILLSKGCDSNSAVLATYYIPYAIIRQLMANTDLVFSDYVCVFSGDGELENVVNLLEQDLFQNAMKLMPTLNIQKILNSNVMRNDTLLNAINHKEKEGVNWKDIQFSPVTIFNSKLTEAGQAKVMEHFDKHMSRYF